MLEALPQGTNLRLLLVGCGCAPAGLTAHATMVEPVVEAVRRCEMTPLTWTGHDFTGAGYSLCVLLAESHLVIHTYPECSESAIIELSVCDHLRENGDRARRLARLVAGLFDPTRQIAELSGMQPRDTDRDEPWLTEPLVHVPLLLHPAPRRVILAPGGAHPRGAEQVLRHPTVEELWVLEPREVGPAAGAVPAPARRAALEGFNPPGPADLVILELGRPGALPLLAEARRWLGPQGIWAARLPLPEGGSGAPGSSPLPAGNRPRFYWQHLPSAGRALFAVGGPGAPPLPDRAGWRQRLDQRGLEGLQVVTPETLDAMFALPPLLGPLLAPFMISSPHG